MNENIFLFLYLIFGITISVITYKKINDENTKVLVTSIVIALFFSLGFAIGRGVAPVPILILIVMSIFEHYFRDTSEGGAYIYIPFLVQFFIIYIVFIAIVFFLKKIKIHRSKRQNHHGNN